MSSNECKHVRVIIVSKSNYNIPQGWDVLQEQGDVDLGKYFVSQFEGAVYCEDCDTILED